MYGGLEADIPGAASTSHGPVVCILGDGPQDAAGDRLLAKKLKKETRMMEGIGLAKKFYPSYFLLCWDVHWWLTLSVGDM